MALERERFLSNSPLFEESDQSICDSATPVSYDSPGSISSTRSEENIPIEEQSLEIRSVFNAFPTETHLEIMAQIEGSWTDLQLPREQRETRLQVLRDGMDDNLTKILKHTLELQKSFHDDIQSRVTKFTKEIRDAQMLLNLAPDSTSGIEDGEDLGLFQREIQLRTRCNELMGLRKKRQIMYDAFMAENRKFSQATGLPSFFLEDKDKRLRTETLEDIQACNADIQTIYVARTRRMTAVRESVEAISVDLRKQQPLFEWTDLTEPNMAAAERLLNDLKLERTANVTESTEIINRIKYLCRRTGISSLLLDSQATIVDRLFDPAVMKQLAEERDRMELEAKQNIRTVVLRHRDRILTLYETTYASAEEREAFTDITSDHFSETLLDSHEAEATRLDNLLEENRLIYELLVEHGRLMREKLKFEEQETDPVVMVNRGGILLKIQAEKKKVIKDLQKLTHDLHFEVERRKLAGGPAVLICGFTLDDFLSRRQRDNEHEKADFLKDRKAAPGSARKPAPGSAMKRAKELNDKDTPTFKRLKNETAANDGTIIEPEPRSAKTKEEPKSGNRAKEPLAEKNTTDRMGRVKKRLEFSTNSGASGGAAKPRTGTRPVGHVLTPASSCGNINTTRRPAGTVLTPASSCSNINTIKRKK